MNDYNEMIKNFNEDSDEVLKEELEKAIKVKHLATGSKFVDSGVIAATIKNCLPVINVVRAKEVSLDDAIPEYRIYDPYKNKWSKSKRFLGNMIFRIRGLLTDKMLNEVENAIIFDPNLPMINDVKSNITISNSKFNHKINFKDEQYDIQTNHYHKIKPNDMIIHKLDFNLAKSINDEFKQICDDFFLTLANNNDSRALVLKQICLAALMQYNPTKKAINFYGKAGTGKSTLLKIIQSLNGNQYANLTYDDLNKDDAIATIGDHSLIIGFDNNDKSVIKNSQLFKTIIGKDEFSYFVKYKDRGKNIFTGLMIQAFNEAPQFTVKGSNKQILDRMLTIKFSNRLRYTENEITDYDQFFTSNENIGKLARYLIDNIEAFDNFCYSDNSINEEIFNENDTVYQFVNNYIDEFMLNQDILMVNHLYELYKEDLRINNPSMKPMSNKKFITKLEGYLNDLEFIKSENRQRAAYFEKRNQYSTQAIQEYFDMEHINMSDSKLSLYFINRNDTESDELTQLMNQARNSKDNVRAKALLDSLKEAICNDDNESIENYKNQLKEVLKNKK